MLNRFIMSTQKYLLEQAAKSFFIYYKNPELINANYEAFSRN